MGCLAPRPGRFTPGKENLYPFHRQEAGWAPGPVWTAAENLASTGIRSPDRPARSKSLYRLSYPGPHNRALYTYINVGRYVLDHVEGKREAKLPDCTGIINMRVNDA
jgi:hypothetical protein